MKSTQLRPGTPNPDTLPLAQRAEAEQASDQPTCPAHHPELDIVCIRNTDHPGPHVGAADGTPLQWES